MEMSLGSENGVRSHGGDMGGFGWEVLSCGEAEIPRTQGAKGEGAAGGLTGDFVL